MHVAVNIELDKTQDFEVPYMSAEQIDYWLNKAIKRIVKQRYGGNNDSRTGFEQTQKRIDDLRLVTNYPQTPLGIPVLLPVTTAGNNFYQSLPTDYWFLVRMDVLTQYPGLPSQINPGQLVKQETVMTLQEDPFNRSFSGIPNYYILGNTVIFPTDGSFQILGTTPYYIRVPGLVQLGTQYLIPGIDINCDLSFHIHDEVVDEAVLMLLENIQEARVQTFSSLERQHE